MTMPVLDGPMTMPVLDGPMTMPVLDEVKPMAITRLRNKRARLMVLF